MNARTVLQGVLRHVGAEISAHEAIVAEQDRWGSIAQLAAEYETIAAAAQHDRWVALIKTSGLTSDQAAAVIESDAFGPLTAELRRAEADHHNVDQLVPILLRRRNFDDAQDLAAVLLSRLQAAANREGWKEVGRRTSRMVAGLVPEAIGAMTPEMRRSLDERRVLMERRVQGIVESSVFGHAAWIYELGGEPPGQAAARWRRQAIIVAAYRDRYGVIGRSPLGGVPTTTAQERDAALARVAIAVAQRLAREEHEGGPQMRAHARGEVLAL